MFRRTVPFIAQTQRTDCGLACVAMILRFYKSFFTLKKLSEFLEPSRDGISFKELNKLLNRLNLQTKIYKITADKINVIPTPAILYWSKGHFVVLDKVGKDSVFIVDPGYGKRKLSYTEFAEDFSNFAKRLPWCVQL